jgi:hypothetical protein
MTGPMSCYRTIVQLAAVILLCLTVQTRIATGLRSVANTYEGLHLYTEEDFDNPYLPGNEKCGRNITNGQWLVQPFHVGQPTHISGVDLFAYRVGITPTAEFSIRPYPSFTSSVDATTVISVPAWTITPKTVSLTANLAPGLYTLVMSVSARNTANVQVDMDCLYTFAYPGYTHIPGFPLFEHEPLFFDFAAAPWSDVKERIWLPLVVRRMSDTA